MENTTDTNPNLSVLDLANIRDILDLAARRGAFAAGEMVAVGTVFNKLHAFVTAAMPQQTPESQTAPAEQVAAE
jgi:hypothetical protein